MPRTQDVWKQLKIDGIAGCQGPKTYCEQQKCSLFKLSCKLLASRSYSPCTSSIRSASHCTNLTEVTLSVHKQMDWQWIGHKQMDGQWIGHKQMDGQWIGHKQMATSKWKEWMCKILQTCCCQHHCLCARTLYVKQCTRRPLSAC